MDLLQGLAFFRQSLFFSEHNITSLLESVATLLGIACVRVIRPLLEKDVARIAKVVIGTDTSSFHAPSFCLLITSRQASHDHEIGYFATEEET